MREIGEFYGVSEKFLTKILQDLVKHNYLESKKGRGGGVRIYGSPASLRVGDIVKKLERNFELAECFEGQSCCPLTSSCGLSVALTKALEAFFDSLNAYSLADLAEKDNNIHVLRSLRSFMVENPSLN